MSGQSPPPTGQPHLLRRFGLLQATALNMTNMIGIGPFITIPLLMSALNGGGPQAMLGWVVAVVIAMADGLVWSELGAAMPGSGGSYGYLREAFGRETFGRFMAFLFIWQFVLSGPLEIASGYIGFANYLNYLSPGMTTEGGLSLKGSMVVVGLGLSCIALLYRRITSIGKITVALWAGSILTTVAVIFTGATHFDSRLAFDFPKGAFDFSIGFYFGLGAASRIGVYDYLGYYDVCYIGYEVREPGKVIPRSILLSIVGVALIYFAMNLSIIGVVPWREFVPAEHNPKADFVVSLFMEKIHGTRVASVFTVMVLWTAFASCFALLLGYSRIPYAAAQDGAFFKIFGRLHPGKNFPHISLVVIGTIAIVCSFLPLLSVIDALLITRILVQFIGQIFAVTLLRKQVPRMNRPYRMWFYPLPAFVALTGWIFVFSTADLKFILYGLSTLALGVVFFLVWSKCTKRWPWAKVEC
ncbi:MAG TPA: APC family permease [Candidatus Angelobacter sp.]|nr:APC family permease [Candidatus Angelobacter sp.]